MTTSTDRGGRSRRNVAAAVPHMVALLHARPELRAQAEADNRARFAAALARAGGPEPSG